MPIFHRKHMKFTPNEFFQEKMRIRKFHDDAMKNKGSSHTNVVSRRGMRRGVKSTVHIFRNFSKTINSFHLLFFLLENILQYLSRNEFMNKIGQLEKKL